MLIPGQRKVKKIASDGTKVNKIGVLNDGGKNKRSGKLDVKEKVAGFGVLFRFNVFPGSYYTGDLHKVSLINQIFIVNIKIDASLIQRLWVDFSDL